ncbi:MAG: hypothetical protein J5817_02000 [Treponema sp.]|nr:hypothetical protein [Treponema sp.]
MLELTVNPNSAVAITSSLKKIKEMIMTGAVPKDTPIHLILEPGIYKETVRYNMPNPLVLESLPGTKNTDCVIQADNCEAFHKGLENRAVFYLGALATNVTLKNFSIINMHNKSIMEGNILPDAAEALVWDNATGTLFAEGLRLEGRQNTLCAKGFAWFKDSYITGDTDFIYGDADTVFFEGCEICIRKDNRGDFDGYAVKSTAMANKSGFVFSDCRFTGDKRKKNNIYIYRTEGHGKPTSFKWWDSVALLNCFVSEYYNPEFGWDDDMSLPVYPRGNAKNGWREYNTKIVSKAGKVTEADTTQRNIKSYTLTDDDFFAFYASRYLILHDTPFVKILDN